MGNEILFAFLIFPVILWTADIIFIFRSRNVRKHAALLTLGVMFLAMCALGFYATGPGAMQGIIWGSLVYPLGYLLTWLAMGALAGRFDRSSH